MFEVHGRWRFIWLIVSNRSINRYFCSASDSIAAHNDEGRKVRTT